MKESTLFNNELYRVPRLVRQGYAGGYKYELFIKPDGNKMERRYESDGRLYSELHLDGNGYYAKKGTRFGLDEDGNILDEFKKVEY